MRHISDDERRRRLAIRHGLAPLARYRDPVSATSAMTVLHSTEAASVYLSLVARVEDLTVEGVDRALYEERRLVKQLAMRRTLFVFGRDLLPSAWASAGARTAELERRKTVKDLVASKVTVDGDAWLATARAGVLEALAGGPLSARALKELVPWIDRTVTIAPGTRWGGEIPVAPRILGWLGARGELVRGPNDGGWWVSRPLWARMDQWLGSSTSGASGRMGVGPSVLAGSDEGGLRAGSTAHAAVSDSGVGLDGGSVAHAGPDAGGRDAPPASDGSPDEVQLDEGSGYRELVRRWLWTFGPGTETDIVWWLGSTKTAVRRALAELGAVHVGLDSGATGWVLPDDLDPVEDPGAWAALLPSLDPTTMGWKQRDFYLHPDDVPFLVDSAGNAGTTAWLDGRVVGCWIQDVDGTVRMILRSAVSREGQELLDQEARRLTAWLDGRVISSVYMARQRQGALLP